MTHSRKTVLRLLGVGPRLVQTGSLPYDNIANITAIYGMRRLLSSYTTNKLIRLRRSSDNAESDFGYAANGGLDAAAITAWLNGANGLVTTWYDQSGNGNNATQSTADNQPLFVSQASGMLLDGSNDHLRTAFVPTGTTTAIARFSGVSNDGAVFGVNNTNALFMARPASAGSTAYSWGANTVFPSTAYTSGTIALAGNQPYKNGSASGSAISGSFSGTSLALYIGARNQLGSGVLNLLAGNIAEMLISSTTYTAQQVSSVASIMEAA